MLPGYLYLTIVLMNYDFFLIFDRISRVMGAFSTGSSRQRREASMQWMLLMFIDENSSVTGTQVANHFMVKHPTATQLINRAEAQGLLSRVPSEDDGRITYLLLTQQGKKHLAETSAVYDARAQRALQHLSDKEHAQLLRLMRKIHDGVEQDYTSQRSS